MKTINNYAELVKEKHALNKTLAPVETDLTGASQAYAKGAKFIYNGIMYQAKTAIAEHDALVLNTNYEAAPDVETQIANEAATRSAMGAKNMIPYPYYNGDSRDTNGILFTVNSDNSVTISGEATADAYFRMTYTTGDIHIPLVSGKSYILSATGKADVALLLRDDSSSNVAVARGADATYDCETSGNYDAIILVENGANYTTPITVYPMLRLATDSNSDYQPYAKTNKELTDDVSSLNTAIANISDTIGENGAKNLLPFDLAKIKAANTSGTWSGNTYTINGVSIVANADGTFEFSGTSNAVIYFYSNPDATFDAGNYIFSGCPAGGIDGNVDNAYRADVTNNGSFWEKEFGDGKEFTLSTSTTLVALMRIGNATNMTGKVFKPMITLASQPNSDYAHYVPYSMTNRGLTENISGKGLMQKDELVVNIAKDNTKTVETLLNGLFALIKAVQNNLGDNQFMQIKSVYFHGMPIVPINPSPFTKVRKTSGFNQVRAAGTFISGSNVQVYDATCKSTGSIGKVATIGASYSSSDITATAETVDGYNIVYEIYDIV